MTTPIDSNGDQQTPTTTTNRPEAEKLEAEKLEAEKLEAEKLEAEKLEAEKLEAEKPEAEKPEAEKLEEIAMNMGVDSICRGSSEEVGSGACKDDHDQDKGIA